MRNKYWGNIVKLVLHILHIIFFLLNFALKISWVGIDNIPNTHTGGEEDGGWRSAERRIHHQLIHRSNMIRWKYTKVYHLCFVGMNCWDFGKWRMLTEWLDVTSLVWRRSIVVLCTSCGPIEHIGLTQTVCDDECMGFLLFLSKKLVVSATFS